MARDLSIIGQASEGPPEPVANQSGDPRGFFLLLALGATELSLTFAGDTMTLPLISYMHPSLSDYNPVDGHDDNPTPSSPLLEQSSPSQSTAGTGETAIPVIPETESPKE
jgi:hypothetical protein